MTFWKPEYADIGGFGDPTARYPLGENMTGFQSKQAAAQAKLNEDDDIQDYGTACVVLNEGSYTLEELKELVAALEKLNRAAQSSLEPIKETT